MRGIEILKQVKVLMYVHVVCARAHVQEIEAMQAAYLPWRYRHRGTKATRAAELWVLVPVSSCAQRLWTAVSYYAKPCTKYPCVASSYLGQQPAAVCYEADSLPGRMQCRRTQLPYFWRIKE